MRSVCAVLTMLLDARAETKEALDRFYLVEGFLLCAIRDLNPEPAD